jgi:hypothetical protein
MKNLILVCLCMIMYTNSACIINIIQKYNKKLNKQILNSKDTKIIEIWNNIIDKKIEGKYNFYVEVWGRGNYVADEQKKELQKFWYDLRFIFHECAYSETSNSTHHIWRVSW